MVREMIFQNGRLADGQRVDIRVVDGVIGTIERAGGAYDSTPSTDLSGRLVVPGFVEGHIHLDTSFYGDTWKPHRPCTNGFDVRERVAFQADNMANAAPMDVRARNQLELCIANGATHMRSHVMVDGSVGLESLRTILAVREEYRDLIDIQIVAFPQSGILSSPGTPELLDEAITLGADLVGGLDPASFDRDVERHLDVVFGVADKRGVGVDVHLHDMGTLGVFEIEQICARTRALGMEGQVAISHAYGLGDVPETVARKTGALLARSGVSIMTNAPGDHAFPPVALLRSEGVTVFSGSDNIRDSWWPFGDGDMLSRAGVIAYRSGFYTDDMLAAAFDVVTHAGAAALGLADYGLRAGARADFVVLDTPHIPQAVVEVPKSRDVYKGGRLVASNGTLIAQ